MLSVVALTAGAFVIAGTLLSLLRSKAWWIRIWDFPRVQLAALGVAALMTGWLSAPLPRPWMHQVFFTARKPRRGKHDVRALDRRFNVLQTNRDAERLIAVLRSVDPDIVLCSHSRHATKRSAIAVS